MENQSSNPIKNIEEKYPKILLAVPTSSHKDYIFQEWSKFVKSLTYPNLDVLLVDNSPDPAYVSVLKSSGFKVLHLSKLPGEELRETMARCNNLIRDYVLLGGYDYLFSLETDIFTPPDVIERLLSHRKKVVGLSYFLFNGCFSRVMTFEKESFGYSSFTKTMCVDQAFWFYDGTLKPVYQLGLGCLLIHRDIIERFSFRIEKNDPAKAHADTYFHADLTSAGIIVYCDTSMRTKHLNGSWHKIPDQF